MSAIAAGAVPEAVDCPATGSRALRGARIAWMLVWRWVVGAALCGSVVLAVVALGWSLRLGRRWGLRAVGWRDERLLPGLVMSEATGGGLLRKVAGGLWANVKVGVPAALNAWAVTLPGGLLMAFSWYAGWNNSFAKGYEQAAVGPLVGFLGIAFFMAAMAYLPIGQARQAVTGKARRFWDYRRVRQVMAQRWLSCLGLGLAYVAAGLVLLVADSLVAFASNARPDIADVPPATLLGELRFYFLVWGLFLFPTFVLLRAWAARIYVVGVRDLVRSGRWSGCHLSDEEIPWALAVETAPSTGAHPAIRAAKGTGNFAGRNLYRVALAAVWFAFVAQIYVAQFFIARPAHRWLSQPLVQIPWFCYLPAHLVKAAEAAASKDS